MNPTQPSVKWTYSTHRIDPARLECTLGPMPDGPEPGAVVLARVQTIGKHREVEDQMGRRRTLFPGDVIAGALGYRYATDQYEGAAVASGPTGHLLGMGGVCGEVLSKNERMPDPTVIEWIGRLRGADGEPISLSGFRIRPERRGHLAIPRTILSVGASMNAGKTTTAAQTIRTLSNQGFKVGAAKITGTACRKDLGIMEDAGAVRILDFTDCGWASTSLCSREDLLAIASDLRAALVADQPDYLVFEIADGVLQRETRLLLEDPGFRGTVDAVTFAGPDSVCCENGVRHLRDLGYNVVAIGGLVANSRLGREETQAATGIPCLNGEMILNGELRHALELSWAA